MTVGMSGETLLVEPLRHVGLEHLGRRRLEHGEVAALDADRGHVVVGGKVEPLHPVALWCDHEVVIWIEVEHWNVDLVEPSYIRGHRSADRLEVATRVLDHAAHDRVDNGRGGVGKGP